ncbi:MAG TPA: phosphatidate cytidylyltransferase [Clostridiales bacterium]|nr:phosphatidate cytidylyltransferase [Clostridia bacterium]MDD4680654.1 phosphatidate cytidylyltransferase [Clostridia bacterium]HCS75111.1 phosphatidate cytidylyltransferase [Clostridiales bacterium]
MLGIRIISAVIALAFVAIILWAGGWYFNAALIAASLIGMYEIYRAFGLKGMKAQSTAAYLAIIFFHIQHFLYQGSYDFFHILITVVLFMSLQVFMHSVKVDNIAITVLGFFYPGILLTTASLMRDAACTNPNYLLILSITASYATDSFAYFTGKTLGKKKLCPAISPAKTIEGSIGGMVGSIILTPMLGILLNWVYNIQVNLIHFIAIGILGGVFSQIGDLTASSIKRYCGVKNYGNIMPGHGGIMDRIDSLLFVLPVVYVYSQLFMTAWKGIVL